MLEVAEIIRLHGAAYRAHVGDRLLPSQARVLRDLAACRTAYFGGQLTQCDHCGQPVYRYHLWQSPLSDVSGPGERALAGGAPR